MLGTSNDVIGQGTYSLSVDSGAYSNLVGATSLNNGQLWDEEDTLIPIGFTFELFDRSYDSIYISDFVWFENNGDYFINAFYANFIDLSSSVSISPKSFLLDGTPGDRILKIEWLDAGFFFQTGTRTDWVNVQLWLYEDSSKIEVRIGSISVIDPATSYNGNEGAVVGLHTYFGEAITLAGAADAPAITTSFEYLTGTPQEGRIYRFSRCAVPTSNFTSNLDSVYNMSFTNTSINASSVLWDFGDGSTSSVLNPSHTFTDTGFFSVKQYAFNHDCYTDSSTQIICIGAPANFSYSLVDGMIVNFSGLAGDTTVTAYTWDFGDGTTSTRQNPSHIFSDSGSFQVSLTVTNVCNNTYTSADSIDVLETGIAQFTSLARPILLTYPNPVSDVLNMSLSNIESGEIQIKLMDITGRTIYKRVIEAHGGVTNFSMDMSQLESAIYFIQLNIGEDIVNEKIFKQQ